MFRRAATGVVLVLVVISTVTVLQPSATTPAEAETRTPLTAPEGFANAEFEIRVFQNGSARWMFRASRPLKNRTEIDQFRQFEQTFESTRTATYRDFKTDARQLVALGTNVTNRSMTATGFRRDARIRELGGTRGIVELSFVWTNFAKTEGEKVIVGDVFEGGFFIDSGQQLVISHGPNLVFGSVDPIPDSQEVEGNLTGSETVTWFGERAFSDKRPRVVFVPPGNSGVDQATPSPTPTPETSPTPTPTVSERKTETQTPTAQTPPSGGFGMLPVTVVFVVLLGLGGGIAWYSGAMPGYSTGGRGGTDAGSSDSTTPTDSPDSAADRAVPDQELLSDEDRVLQLLEEKGGRMKQVNIVEETDWSKSKVSMLLSDMEDDGQISKLRVGRENIVSLAGEEPDAAGSPFDDE